MTWLLAAEDQSAPNHETIPKLLAYRNAGKPFTLVVFEGADHSMLVFNEDNGERTYTGYAPDYFRTEVDNVMRMSSPQGPGHKVNKGNKVETSMFFEAR